MFQPPTPPTKGKEKDNDGSNVGNVWMDLAKDGSEDGTSTPTNKEVGTIPPPPAENVAGTNPPAAAEKDVGMILPAPTQTEAGMIPLAPTQTEVYESASTHR